MSKELKKLIERHKTLVKADGPQKAIESMFSDLEKLIEDTGQTQKFQQAITRYVSERTSEIISIRTARKWMLRIGTTMALFVLFAFYYVLLCPDSQTHLADIPDATKVAFVSASFLSAFGLIAIILRGILRAGEKEESVGVLPEQLKTLGYLLKESAQKTQLPN